MSVYSGYYLSLGFSGWNEGLHATGTAIIFFLVIFSSEFLELKNFYPKINRLFHFVAGVVLLCGILINLKVPYTSLFFNIFSSIFFVLLFGVVIVLLKKQSLKKFKFYLYALMIYMPSMGLMTLAFNSLVPNTDLTRYSFLFGSFCEIFFFSFIIASKYNETQKHKKFLQAKLLQKVSQLKSSHLALEQSKNDLQSAYEEIEQRVIERTHELHAVNKQLRQEVLEHRQARISLNLKNKAFENTSEAIVITNSLGIIVDINIAFSTISGYSRNEVIGKNPGNFKSGRHDEQFYQTMWQTLTKTGCWSGEIWDRRKNGELYPKHLVINAVKNEDQKPTHYVGVFSDITEFKATENKLQQLAYFDPLTGLANRILFNERLSYSILLDRRKQTNTALLFIDLDRFKTVNDTLGHHIGDELLQQVAQRILGCVRETDTVARMGGDEFTVILCCVENETQLDLIAQKIIKVLHEAFNLLEHEVFIGASIGIASFPDDGIDKETLLKNADAAMYRAKEMGRGCVEYYREELNSAADKRI